MKPIDMTAAARILTQAARIAFVAALCVIAYYAFKPAGTGGGLFPWDKADHFSAFFVLTGLAITAFPKQSFLRIAIAIAILGALIEIIQGLPIVNRDCDFWDWVAEMCALSAVYGSVLAANIRRRAADQT